MRSTDMSAGYMLRQRSGLGEGVEGYIPGYINSLLYWGQCREMWMHLHFGTPKEHLI